MRISIQTAPHSSFANRFGCPHRFVSYKFLPIPFGAILRARRLCWSRHNLRRALRCTPHILEEIKSINKSTVLHMISFSIGDGVVFVIASDRCRTQFSTYISLKKGHRASWWYLSNSNSPHLPWQQSIGNT